MPLHQVTVLIESNKHPGVVGQSVDKVLTKAGAKVREVHVTNEISVERFEGMDSSDPEHTKGTVQQFDVPSDNDPFPFGKHKGTPYGKVPADYLDWISGEEWLVKWPKVEAYIVANRSQIDADLDE